MCEGMKPVHRMVSVVTEPSTPPLQNNTSSVHFSNGQQPRFYWYRVQSSIQQGERRLFDANLSCSDVARTIRVVCDDEISNHTRRTPRHVSHLAPQTPRPQQTTRIPTLAPISSRRIHVHASARFSVRKKGTGVHGHARREGGVGKERAVNREIIWCT